MLRNKLYTGIYELHKAIKSKEIVLSPVMESLVIVSKEEFLEAERILTHRKPLALCGQRTTVHGTLLSGLLYCGVCGRKFSTHTTVKKCMTNEGIIEKKNSRYRCTSYNFPKNRKETCDQKYYKARILECTVVEESKRFLLTVDKDKLLNQYRSQTEIRLGEITARTDRAEAEKTKAERELARLKEEIVKVLFGESRFSEALITEQIAKKEQEVRFLDNELTEAQNEIFLLDQELSAQTSLAEELDGWAERFDRSPMQEQKAMLMRIISKITITGDNVDIDYSIKLNSSKNYTITPIDPENPIPLLKNVVKGSPQARR
jgi:hypothetical protein